VEAAWLHHAFTQIHPFQDGNGRVARALASLVFIKGGWFPLTLTRDDRTAYIEALEHADDADLMALLTLFGTIQKRTFVKILGIAGQVRQRDTVDQVIGAAKDLLAKRQRTLLQQYERAKETADLLRARAAERFGAIATKLAGELGRIHEEYRFSVDSEPNDGARRHYFRFQVIENARTLDYFANLSEYHAWTRLVLRTDTQAEVLLSFHGIGHEYRGVLAATLSFFRREETEDGERQISDIVPASHAIFQVNYRELDKEAERRFDEWLEPALVNALEIWRATL
jgi:hypothetical protein